MKMECRECAWWWFNEDERRETCNCPSEFEAPCEREVEYRICPECGNDVVMDDMLLTTDCHGIPYRYVCPDCYDELMERGYDGERYTTLDENVWGDDERNDCIW